MLLAGLTACSFGPDARTKHTPKPHFSRLTPSPTPSGIYTIDDFDTCRETDTKLLGSLATKTDRTKPEEIKSEYSIRASSRCTFYMRDPAANEVILETSVETLGTIEENKKELRESRFASNHEGMRDYTIEGIGDEAYGKSDRRHGFSTDMLFVIQGNLTVSVILSLDRPDVPRSKVAPMIQEIAQDLLDAATKD